jgi:hypothetical protein
MNSNTQDYPGRWRLLRQEFEDRASRLGAIERVKYQSALDAFTDELYAAGEWTKATWDEYVNKVDKKWHELTIKSPE